MTIQLLLFTARCTQSKARCCYRKSSVRLSVCDVDGRMCWDNSKLIRVFAPRATTSAISPRGTSLKFGWNRDGVPLLSRKPAILLKWCQNKRPCMTSKGHYALCFKTHASFGANNENVNEDRPMLSATKMQPNDSSFWLYEDYSDICGGSPERGVKRQWCSRKHRFSGLWDATSSAPYEMRLTLLHTIVIYYLQSLVTFPLTLTYMVVSVKISLFVKNHRNIMKYITLNSENRSIVKMTARLFNKKLPLTSIYF